MQPTSYPINHDTLQQIWLAFMDSGQVPPHLAAAADPAVLQSWRRCALRAGTSPRPKSLREPALTSILRAQSDFIALSTPFLEDMYQFMEGSDCAILLADGTACVLALGGNATMSATIDRMGLGQGSYWAEGQLGTTALGMCMLEAMPIQVVGAEHYFQAFHHLSTSAAPIHHVNGRIIGIIAIVAPVTAVTSHTLSLVMSVARAISGQLQTDLFLEEANRRLTEVNTVLEAIDEGVIAWNESGQINHINPQAGRLLRLNPATVLGQVLSEVMRLPEVLKKAINENRELQDVEMNFHVNGTAISCLLSLRPINAGSNQPIGHIAMLRPIEHVRRLVQQQVGAQATLKLEDMSDQSAAMRRILRQARTAARGTAPVLLRGEGGVGKNYLARAIHNDSDRADKPFLSINCRAIPHELMPQEFLGYEKMDASSGRPSKFELANHGTLLLDQIEGLSLEMQAALVHVIETSHIMRLGSSHPAPVNVRIMAATSANLEQAVSDGNFLPHLYYRFGIFSITVPPLRDRVEDIPLLAESFLARVTLREKRPTRIDDEALAILRRYPWPGNVRELENALERAMNQCTDSVIRVEDLPEVVRRGRVLTGWSPQPQPILTVAEAEREAIIRAGWACEGRVGEMAQQLQMGRTTLWRKMKRLDISPAQFRR
ncbi:MAG: PTS-dependent dihydroxyacetone kinase operon transcriptional regulator DhaR [Anaerolineales bacterium]|nr:PTS-dependent dihydroxyacetone kinase operon transcriptional regulator DhaR [Anaerolineales bacterium]MCB8952760.1 PTS-dependent dihydroxyacetone kinase operon transcriptional regulator DhaR [Ardenticatenales bacterium]